MSLGERSQNESHVAGQKQEEQKQEKPEVVVAAEKKGSLRSCRRPEMTGTSPGLLDAVSYEHDALQLHRRET